jgi:hypothetical protein
MMIASFGPCLPLDLLEATGRHAGQLPWLLGEPTPRADQWLESKFPVWSRSIVEQWATGRFDELDAVVFSRGDDAVQRVYYYICELQRRRLIGGPQPIIFDLAQIPRATSEAHTIASVRRLAAMLEIDDAALEVSIARLNARRAATSALRGDGPACLIAGTPPPQRLLHDAVVTAGFAAVGPTLAEAWSSPGRRVDEASGDPAATIGRQVFARSNDRRGFLDLGEETAARAREAGASAAVLWYSEEDEARVWELPRVRDALATLGVPALVMTRRDEAGADGASEEIRAFLKGLGS